MKITINTNDVFYAKEMMQNWNRDYFSIPALEAIINFYDECCEEEIEFNPVDICCTWTEYTPDNLMGDYGYMIHDDEEKTIEKLIDLVADRTYTKILRNKNILVMAF